MAAKILRPCIEAEFATRSIGLSLLLPPFWAERFSPRLRRLRGGHLSISLAASVSKLELDLPRWMSGRSVGARRTHRARCAISRTGCRLGAHGCARSDDGMGGGNAVCCQRCRSWTQPDKISKLSRLQFVRRFLNQALRDGFFHADLPHQGNLFVDAEGRLVSRRFPASWAGSSPGMRRFLTGDRWRAFSRAIICAWRMSISKRASLRAGIHRRAFRPGAARHPANPYSDLP